VGGNPAETGVTKDKEEFFEGVINQSNTAQRLSRMKTEK
jgi:hypothetical protein